MSKQFTKDDVVEVTKAAKMLGVEAVWCTVLFKGCTNPVAFYATPHKGENEIHLGDDFQADMYEWLMAGEFGEIKENGVGEWYITIPPSQTVIEETVVAKRNQLLLESDYSEFPSTQAKLTEEEKTAWADYRQALRDLTDQEGFPWDPVWPVKP